MFSVFADLGIGNAAIVFLSRAFAKKKGLEGGYYSYLLKIKIFMLGIVSVILIFSAKYIAEYYRKPLFFALIAGIVYLAIVSLMNFYSAIFQAKNDFKTVMYKEIILQSLRLIIVPLTIFYSLSQSSELIIVIMFLSVSISYFVALAYLFIKRPKFEIKELDKNKKREVNKFVIPLTATVISGVFFGSIDMLMLGRVVAAQTIGYYSAALNLATAIMTLASFAAVLFPIFSRITGNQLKRAFRKSFLITAYISIIVLIGVLIFAWLGIWILYGSDYLPATNILRIFAVLILIDPFIGLYSNYYISQGRTMILAKMLGIAILLNIGLNYFFIQSLIVYGHVYAAMGAAIATVLSRGIYLFILYRGSKAKYQKQDMPSLLKRQNL